MGHAGDGELVDAAFKGLKGEFHDQEIGGWYPGVTAEGAILADKQCYAHAFVLLTSSSAILAGRIIDHVISWTADNKWRIPEHFTKEWKAKLEYNKE